MIYPNQTQTTNAFKHYTRQHFQSERPITGQIKPLTIFLHEFN